MNNIGLRIKKLRKKNDLTQEKLADFLGVTYKAVSKWECGMTVPDLALIVPLTRILHVTADELLGGNDAENDARRAELDERCENYWKYDHEETYQMACQAVSEYPGDYKYLAWLAQMEQITACHKRHKMDPETLERSIKHTNMVIEECTDSGIREKAIWNAMFCCKTLERDEEALKYAEMFPAHTVYTRDKAMLRCLKDERLLMHQQMISFNALSSLFFGIFGNISICIGERAACDGCTRYGRSGSENRISGRKLS